MVSRTVAAGMTVLGFREDLDQLSEEYYKNAENRYGSELASQGIDQTTISQSDWENEVLKRMERNPKSDIQVILDQVPDLEWSAPKQDLVDGVLFFYLGDRAAINARRCLRLAPDDKHFQKHKPLLHALELSADYILKNARQLIGAARVKSISAYGTGVGFRGRNFATIDSQNFHFFEHPLSLDFLKALPMTINGPTVYSLVGDKSTRIVAELRKKNRLPRWLDELTFGDTLYSHITPENWLTTLPTTTIVLDSSATSSPEQLLRFHFFNHFIKDIADPRAPILEETPHWDDNGFAGYSDYMFQLNGTWVPFEAKVNVNSERDILAQLRKYTHSITFTMTQEESTQKVRQQMPTHRVCLLGDQHGIYLTVNNQFVDCAQDRPRWHRRDFSRALMTSIKETIQIYL
jgi:hypothetical protein